MVVEEIEASAR